MKTEYTRKSEYRGYTEVDRYNGTIITTISGEHIGTFNLCKIYKVTAEKSPTAEKIVYYDVVSLGMIVDRRQTEREAIMSAKAY